MISLLVSFFLTSSILTPLALAPLIYDHCFPGSASPDPDLVPGLVSYEKCSKEMREAHPRKTMQFVSHGHKLQGYYYPQKEARGLLVFTHGMKAGADSHLSFLFALHDLGYAVFAYDLTGCHESEGVSLYGLPQAILDLEAAVKYLDESKVGAGLDRYLIGHSLGAYASLAVLHVRDDIKGVISLAGFNDAGEVIIAMARRRVFFFADLTAPFVLGHQDRLFGPRARYRAIDGLRKKKTAALIVQGQDDDSFPPDHLSIYAAVEKKDTNCDRWLMEGEGHTLLLYENDDYIDQINAEYDNLGKDASEETKRAFIAAVDDERYSQPSRELIERIGGFLTDQAMLEN